MRTHSSLPPVLTSAEAREWERRFFESGRLQERVLLESAGRAAALAVAMNFPEGRVVGAIGRGSNGGDAVVALRTLRAWGREVQAVLAADAQLGADWLHGWEVPIPSDGLTAFEGAGVIIDGILGTGASGPPRPSIMPVIEAINASGRPVVALDGPTGVDLSTGEVAGGAVAATLTVTFGVVKRGLLLHPGRRLAGRILVAEIGYPPAADTDYDVAVITDAWTHAIVPRIAPDAYKGSVGLVGVVAGRTGLGGAAIMVAMGALRAGSGGVRVASTESNRVAIQSAVPEAVFLDRASPETMEGLAGTAAIVVGPGIGVGDESEGFLRALLDHYEGPFVLDADALTLLARNPALLPEGVGQRCVLTPHPGELARLLDTPPGKVQADRIEAASAAARRFGCAVLSKGAPSLVAAPSGTVLIALSGHSGVATGGMGDTLSGIVGAFLAGGVAPVEAAAAAIHLAGRAAEAAGRGRGLLPRDVADSLPEVFLAGREDRPSPPFLLDLPAPR